mmetsp:Transcript_14494/g.56973  ORF Transcript_14494/g.56973 Transcript_14494/m.56973 type:complete len:183 (+) Transcript_14494:109-657(+)|eukprot:CAMPEP_0114615560 /NCGR_PEP_ID=MMETSP0168-20121206/6227_1 /TAXON_ID=95228 ORGANISM="Vannella sp., Strain DIVA3 517/6/12" /NCGR_SAMPLE_ID=MMETSP0168 /ASSEMBLY_ACC=CAM_ASM_000044 /LENGTH=182 /DNA_ID=CAMNT_0001826633 /DNA_START=120 /DNA_END=668 /DNA_ORIENTATION=-
MGVVFSSLWQRLFSNREVKVIIVGLDNAGKTTTLYKLMLDEVVMTGPTIGSNVEEIVHNNIHFLMWDIGGQESSRASWSTYYTSTDAVVLVIDSMDRSRINIVRAELQKILTHESLKEGKLLVYANKQDITGAMSAAEVSDALHLHDIKEHDWHIQGCCALTGEGLFEGLDWVTQKISDAHK